MKTKRGQEQSGVASLLPPEQGAEVGAQSDVLNAIHEIDQHIEADRRTLQSALDTINTRQKQADEVFEQRQRELNEQYEKETAENARQRQEVLNRMSLLGGGEMKKRGRRVVARTKRVYKMRQPRVAGTGRRGRRGEDTEFVLAVMKGMGKGAFSNAEIADAVHKKKPGMDRKKIDAALQALRGRMVKGKQVGAARVKVTGKPRAYKYRVLV